eukprot:5457122-Heterocapsa_arctica.AAC.1
MHPVREIGKRTGQSQVLSSRAPGKLDDAVSSSRASSAVSKLDTPLGRSNGRRSAPYAGSVLLLLRGVGQTWAAVTKATKE